MNKWEVMSVRAEAASYAYAKCHSNSIYYNPHLKIQYFSEIKHAKVCMKKEQMVTIKFFKIKGGLGLKEIKIYYKAKIN